MQLLCQTHRVHPDIRGEDVATVMLSANRGSATVSCELGYAENYLERECFPQTLMLVEGEKRLLRFRGKRKLGALRVFHRDGGVACIARAIWPAFRPCCGRHPGRGTVSAVCRHRKRASSR